MKSNEICLENLKLTHAGVCQSHITLPTDEHRRERSQSFIPYEDMVKRRIFKGLTIRYISCASL